MVTCLNPAHFKTPDLINCSLCRKEYQEYLNRQEDPELTQIELMRGFEMCSE